MCNQRGYVLATFAQRREQNRKHVEAVVQVTAKFIARDHLSKIMMGRRHQTDINAMQASTTQTLKLALAGRVGALVAMPEADPQFHPGKGFQYVPFRSAQFSVR